MCARTILKTMQQKVTGKVKKNEKGKILKCISTSDTYVADLGLFLGFYFFFCFLGDPLLLILFCRIYSELPLDIKEYMRDFTNCYVCDELFNIKQNGFFTKKERHFPRYVRDSQNNSTARKFKKYSQIILSSKIRNKN